MQRYGWKDVKAISQHVGTRNPTQVRTHAQKLLLRQQKEQSGLMLTGPGGEGGSQNHGQLLALLQQEGGAPPPAEGGEDPSQHVMASLSAEGPGVPELAPAAPIAAPVAAAEPLPVAVPGLPENPAS